MPNYLQECPSDSCGYFVETGERFVFEHLRLIAERGTHPPCPKCGAVTERTFAAATVTGLVDPVVVYKGPDGQVRFPGTRGSGFYEKKGYERIEIRGALEMRKFESVMNRHEYSRASRKTEYQQQAREEQARVLRSELRARFSSMTRAGRDLARAAFSMNDNKPVERTRDAGFHSEVYSYNRSNREEARGNDGRRLRD